MAEKKTERQYKRTFRNTVGTGMSSLAGGSGRRYFVLEHRDNSKYHKAGESQKIIIDHIELGCNPDCQVRFDQETWGIVSRRHAAIVREGDRWKLIHLSTVNSTFLNGRKIDSQWYLESGDEIQLAVGGPRLGFIAPEGRQGLVSSIRMTERLELFRKQALKPYKRAIAAMAIILVLAVGGLGAWNVMLQKNLINQSETIANQAKEIKGNKEERVKLSNELAEANKKIGNLVSDITRVARRNSGTITKIVVKSDTARGAIDACLKNVYHVTVIPFYNGEPMIRQAWTGTGFLLNNGTFVTAQHMVHVDGVGTKVVEIDDPDNPGKKKRKTVIDENSDKTKCNGYYYTSLLTMKMVCVSSDDDFTLSYTYQNCPFKLGNSEIYSDSYRDEEGRSWTICTHDYSGGDWAYAKVNRNKEGLAYDSKFSMNMPVKTPLHIFGFPSGQAPKTRGSVSPIYSQSVTSRNGLEDDGTIKTSNDDSDHGNSGGPVLVNRDGKYIVVGILSGVTFGSDMSHRKGCIIPIGAAF